MPYCDKCYHIIEFIITFICTSLFLWSCIYLLNIFAYSERLDIELMSWTGALISGLCILGIVMKYPRMIKPFLFLSFVTLLFSLCFLIIGYCCLAFRGASNDLLTTVKIKGACLLALEFIIYCMCCRLYVIIKRENNLRAENSSHNEGTSV